MKSLVTFFILFLSCMLYAQIPNAGFENWTGNTPDNWYANNFPSMWTTITKSSTTHSGTGAVRGEVVSFSNTIVPPYINSGVSGTGFAFTQRPASIRGYYQFNSVQGDDFTVGVLLYNNSQAIAAGSFETTANAGSYTYFAADINYVNSLTPDNCIIIALIGNSVGDEHVGSYFLLDDLEFSDQTVGVNDGSTVNSFMLEQNYPNPFNPSTRIDYQVPSEDLVTLKIYDVIGNEVATVVNEVKTAGSYHVDFNSAGLSSGLYFYRLTWGSSDIVKKMTILK